MGLAGTQVWVKRMQPLQLQPAELHVCQCGVDTVMGILQCRQYNAAAFIGL